MGRLSELFTFGKRAEFVLSLSDPHREVHFSDSDPVEIDPMSIDQHFRRLNDLEGTSPSVGRRAALSIPAVLHGRNLICNIGTLPLVCYRGDNELVPNDLLKQIDPYGVSNVVTLQNTVEDLLMDSVSFWRITGEGWNRYPVSAYHVKLDSVSVVTPSRARPVQLPCGDGYHPDGDVYIEGVKVDRNEIIRFYSPHPPFRKTVGAIIRRAIKTARTSEMFADNPMPKLLFTPKLDDPVATSDEIRVEIQKFADSANDSPYNYVGAALDAKPLEFLSPAELQLVEIEKSINLGIANALGLDPEDLGISTTSRTYQNDVDRRKNRINDLLNPFMQAIEQPLSAQNVTPRGYRIVFLQDDYLRADPKSRMEIHTGYITAGVMTVDEVRAKEGLPPLTPQQKRQLAPKPTQPIQATVGDPIQPKQITASATFAGTSETTFSFVNDQTFAVDVERRIIRGLAVPAGAKSVLRNGRHYVFNPGSLKFADKKRVKLLRDHDWSQLHGWALDIVETERGWEAEFTVGPGIKNDELLAIVKHGTLDGMSVGVSNMDVYTDANYPGVNFVRSAELNEVSLCGKPAFEDSRVSAVYSQEGDTKMNCTRCGATDHVVDTCTAPDPEQTFSIKDFQKFQQIQQMFGQTVEAAKAPADKTVTSVQEDPNVAPRQTFTAPVTPVLEVTDRPVYTFDSTSEFSFANDIRAALKGNDDQARKRVESYVEQEFAVSSTNAASLNPTIQRPEMYVDNLGYEYPIWNTINKGAPPNGVTPFQFPKWSSSSGLVADHVEGTEPSLGAFAVTNQQVTPTALSGKIEINREAWDQMGSPSLDNLVRAEMRRTWYEGLETAAGTFLDGLTLTGQETTITTAAADTALQGELIGALVDMLFTRGGYRLRDFMVQGNLYKKLALAKDGNGRLLFPPMNPQNAAGVLASFFANLNINGLIGRPAWALGAMSSVADNSYLFAREDVHGWATAPQFLEFDIQVKSIYIGIWGYKAFANSRTAGIRRFIYDPV